MWGSGDVRMVEFLGELVVEFCLAPLGNEASSKELEDRLKMMMSRLSLESDISVWYILTASAHHCMLLRI